MYVLPLAAAWHDTDLTGAAHPCPVPALAWYAFVACGAFRRDDYLNNATAGDAVAWVPHSRTLYAGDLLFIGGTPIVWAGPYKNWVTACERMVSQPD